MHEVNRTEPAPLADSSRGYARCATEHEAARYRTRNGRLCSISEALIGSPPTNSASACETHAREFLDARHASLTGAGIVARWVIGTHVDEGKNNHYEVQKPGR